MSGTSKNGGLDRCVVLLAMLGLAGCADIPTGGLRPVAPPAKLELKERLAYPVRPGVPVHITLSEGAYIGDLSDDQGVFYLGPSGCYQNLNPDADVLVVDDCGIYVPSAPGQVPRVFHVVGARRVYKLPAGTAVLAASDPYLFTQSIANTVSTATPLQAGVGAALAGGIISSIETRRRGNYQFLGALQPPADSLRKALDPRKYR